jgi:hypothetical protein
MLTIGRLAPLILTAALYACNAAHGPVLDRGTKPENVTGTISGVVRFEGGGVAAGRRVTAVNLATGQRIEASTATNGGYTMKVPSGKYRLEVELRDGERVTDQPEETELSPSDLDPGRDFVIGRK